MFRRYLVGFAAAAALAATGLLLLPETSHAQRFFRGGGLGGGYRGGSYGGWGGYGGGYYGGLGGLRIGVGNYWPGYSGYGYPYGYSNSYYSRYYSPSYSYYSTPGYSYYTPSYSYSNVPPVYYGLGESTQSYQSFYPPDDTSSTSTVHMRVNVPAADAEVWFEGAPTQQRGTTRDFESPPLTPGREYTYHIRARWMENGQMKDQTRTIRVQTGQSLNVDFNTPDTTGTAIDNQRTTDLPGANTGRPAAPPTPNQPIVQPPQTPAPSNPPPSSGEVGPTGRVVNPPPAPPR